MNRMYLPLGIALMLTIFGASVSHAQTIQLQKSNKVVVLDNTTKWLVVEKVSSGTKCCNSNRVTGKIFNVTNDSITIAMERIQVSFKDKELMRLSDEKYISDVLPNYSMAKSDIQFIQEDDNRDLKKGMKYIGGALLLTGIATGIHSLMVESEDRSVLLTSAGIQVGSSILLFSLSRSKKKYVIREGAWSF